MSTVTPGPPHRAPLGEAGWPRTGSKESRSALGRLIRHRDALAAALFLLGPFAYHQALTPGWVIADWDYVLYFLPYRSYLAEAWLHGRWLPLWNPHIYLGAPFLANIQAAALYPPNLLLAVLPAVTAMAWLAALHTGLAGAGMYLYAVHAVRLGRAGSTVTALVYMLGALMVSHSGQLNQLSTLAWAPWLMLAVDRAAVSLMPVRMAAVAVLVALIIGAGHTQQAYFCFLLAVIAAARPLWSIAVRRRLYGRAIRTVFMLGVAVALGAALMALQLAATLELTGQSVRSGGLALADAGVGALPFRGFMGDLLPDYMAEHRAEFASSVGAAVLPLIGIALIVRWRRPRVWWWALLCIVALGVAFGPRAKIYDVFYYLLPGFDLFRVPARVLLFVTVAAAILAGEGTSTVQQLAIAWRRPRWRPVIAKVVVGTFVVSLLSVLAPVSVLLSGNQQHGLFRAFQPIEPANVLMMTGFEAAALALIVVGLSWNRAMFWLVPIVVLADLLALASHTFPMNPLPATLVQTQPVTAGLIPQGTNERYLALVPANISQQPVDPIPSNLSAIDRGRYESLLLQIESIAPDLSMTAGTLDADGYDGGILPIKSYVSFRKALVPPNGSNPPDFTDRLLGPRLWESGWLERAAVNTVVTENGTDPNPPGTHSVTPTGRIGWLVAWQPTGQRATRAHLEDGRLARIISDAGERVVIRLPAGASGRLVLADTYYPGWTAQVDGRPARVERYDGYVRALNIPMGAREVVFEYRPPWLNAAKVVSAAAALVTLGLGLQPLIAALRRRAQQG